MLRPIRDTTFEIIWNKLLEQKKVHTGSSMGGTEKNQRQLGTQIEARAVGAFEFNLHERLRRVQAYSGICPPSRLSRERAPVRSK
jgi:hypothetical protein